MASRLCTRSFAEYKVGEISQALLGKNTAKNPGNYGNEKLGALFGSARLLQPEFVPITPKVRVHVGFRDWWSWKIQLSSITFTFNIL